MNPTEPHSVERQLDRAVVLRKWFWRAVMFMGILAISLATWIGWREFQHSLAVEKLRQADAKVIVSERYTAIHCRNFPVWLRDTFLQVDSIQFHGRNRSRTAAAEVRHLRSVKSIIFIDFEETSSIAQAVDGCVGLERLIIGQSPGAPRIRFSDANPQNSTETILSKLESQPRLRLLNFLGVELSEPDLIAISKLTSLESVAITECQFQTEHLKHIHGMVNPPRLILGPTKPPDQNHIKASR